MLMHTTTFANDVTEQLSTEHIQQNWIPVVRFAWGEMAIAATAPYSGIAGCTHLQQKRSRKRICIGTTAFELRQGVNSVSLDVLCGADHFPNSSSENR